MPLLPGDPLAPLVQIGALLQVRAQGKAAQEVPCEQATALREVQPGGTRLTADGAQGEAVRSAEVWGRGPERAPRAPLVHCVSEKPEAALQVRKLRLRPQAPEQGHARFEARRR